MTSPTDPPPPSPDPLPPSQRPLPALPLDAPVRRFSVRPTPRQSRMLKSIYRPAFWILCLLVAVSAWRLWLLLHATLTRFPAATFTAILLFAVWAMPFWMFISSMDFMEREPPLLLTTAFVWGAVVATMAAIPGNRAVLGLTAKLLGLNFAMAWGPAISGPAIEEALKALGLVMIALIARPQINSVLDGMVYGALIGLGFQVVENVFYALNSVELANQGDTVAPVVGTFFLRGFLAGLWSHTLFSALAGAGIAWYLVRTEKSLPVRWGGVLVGFGLAWSIHFIWNSPLLVDGVGVTPGGVLVGLLLKGLPAFLLGLILLWVARRREANFYVDRLEALRDPLIATPAELYTLRYGRLRANARRYAKFRAGTGGEKAVKALQLAQARLAVELSRAPNGLVSGDSAILHIRDDVLEIRNRLFRLAHPEGIASPLRPTGLPFPRVVVTGVLAGIVLFLLVWYAISSMHGA